MEDPKSLFFSLKIPTGTQKNVFEICKKFGHAPAEGFASCAIESE